jgi:hypothetical protein
MKRKNHLANAIRLLAGPEDAQKLRAELQESIKNLVERANALSQMPSDAPLSDIRLALYETGDTAHWGAELVDRLARAEETPDQAKQRRERGLEWLDKLSQY